MAAYAIVPAAGLSTRMGSTTGRGERKQLLEFHGAPLLVHTLRKIDGSARLKEIFVPVRAEDRERILQRIEAEKFRHPVRLVEGGETRQESVWSALKQIPADAEVVVVHDAVRPFIDAETFDRAIEAAARHGAAIVAVPAVDTIKQVERIGPDARIAATLPRERIVLAQTPQAFSYALLRSAFETAISEGFHATDESALVEHLGHDVFVVAGSPRNWKITTPADLELAERMLAGS